MQRQLGFNLIEVMVALVILSLGVLGMAALQTTAIKQNQSAYMRSQANQLAYDITDRMRANRANLTAYLQKSAGVNTVGCTTTDGCSGSQMAEDDLAEWFDAIARELPGGAGEVCRSNLSDDAAGAPDCEGNGTDNPVVVYIWWDDERDGADMMLSLSTDL
ncbi:MAG: type IV pilus modification protein PilV [Amphritea sp.]|nr:type IV pilus modification protein PilV [Amphritea sp.]